MLGAAVRTGRVFFLGAVLAAAGSCGTDQQHASLVSGSGGSSGASGSAGTSGTGNNCADLFSDDRITSYELQIAQADWDALVHDFYSMQQNDDLNLDIHPYHPITEFKYGNEVVHERDDPSQGSVVVGRGARRRATTRPRCSS